MSDYISKEDAMTAVDKCRCDTFQQLSGMKGYLNAIPSADVVEVRHSAWKEVLAGMDYEYECTRCKACVEREYPYCPNCGAKMDKEEQKNG